MKHTSNKDQASTSQNTSSESSEHHNNGGSPPSSLAQGRQQRTQDQKKMDRILANRRSARRSRERRNKYQQNLEVSVALLRRQNEELSRENNMLKQELRVLINLANQMIKHGTSTMMPASDLGTELLLQQVLSAPVANRSNITASSSTRLASWLVPVQHR